jgi:hypothetical protein
LKRKITYGLLTVLLLGGLYFGLRFAFGLFTPFNFWTARQDIENGKVQIADIGELPLNHRQKQSLANSYGFGFYYFGCNISTDIINGTTFYNRAMVAHLENKLGAGWWTKFQNQLDSIDHSMNEVVLQSKIAIQLMQGLWFHDQDSLASLMINNYQWTFNYEGEQANSAQNYSISITDKLPEFVKETEKAEFLILTSNTDTLKYEILGVTDSTLSLMYFPAGKIHLYRRLK